MAKDRNSIEKLLDSINQLTVSINRLDNNPYQKERLDKQMQKRSRYVTQYEQLVWEQWIQTPEALIDILRNPKLGISPKDRK